MGVRVISAVAAGAVAVGLAGCSGTSNPIVASERQTADDLVADLRAAGVCPRGPTLTVQDGPLSEFGPLAGTDAVFGTCSDDYQVAFYPPSGTSGITTVFNPMVCSLMNIRPEGVEAEPKPVVWGLNWIVFPPFGTEDTAGLEAVARTTMGELTTQDAMYSVFCDAWNSS